MTTGVGAVVRGKSSEAAPRIVATAGKVFSALSFIRKDEVRKLAGVLAGLVVLQKLAGGVWRRVL